MERRHPMMTVIVLIALSCCVHFLAIGLALDDQLPFPEPANENAYAVPIENIRMRVWAQYRVMYNASNIPSSRVVQPPNPLTEPSMKASTRLYAWSPLSMCISQVERPAPIQSP